MNVKLRMQTHIVLSWKVLDCLNFSSHLLKNEKKSFTLRDQTLLQFINQLCKHLRTIFVNPRQNLCVCQLFHQKWDKDCWIRLLSASYKAQNIVTYWIYKFLWITIFKQIHVNSINLIYFIPRLFLMIEFIFQLFQNCFSLVQTIGECSLLLRCYDFQNSRIIICYFV